MKNWAALATALGAAAFFGSISAADASLIITPTNTTDTFKAEPGQGVPTGTGGYVGGTVTAVDAGTYVFTYLGPGDSSFLNSFTVDGFSFCTQAGMAACGGGAATAVGTQFSLIFTAGEIIPFTFNFGPTSGSSLTNGQINNDVGAYLAQIGLGTTAFAGPGTVAYLGLSDNAYPTLDSDFQDLALSITEVPEPASLALLSVGLIGLAAFRRRRKAT